MRIKTGPIPVPDQDAQLHPGDFTEVLLAVPRDCVLIGGQAVAWWADRYGLKVMVQGQAQTVTSRDIDFWGTREDLVKMASRLKRTPYFPNRYEMTLLVGAIELETAGKKTVLEVLHAVPGLDSSNPRTVAVPAEINVQKKVLILSPVSMVLAKLHALRHFHQKDRQDLAHLRVSLEASKVFIAETLQQSVRLALWNCHRLIDAQGQKPNRKIEQKYGLQILSAIPLESLRREVQPGHATSEDRERMQKFLHIQWPRVA